MDLCKNCGCDKSTNVQCPKCEDGVTTYYAAEDMIREAFEKYIHEEDYPGSMKLDKDGQYESDDTFTLWLGFQAGWEAMGEQF